MDVNQTPLEQLELHRLKLSPSHSLDKTFRAKTPPDQTSHPFPPGHTFYSPGGHFTYRVVGPCCRLFDREELPWPCCRLEWRGKEPSWRRIGRRFVPDMATKNSPSYCVEVLGQEQSGRTFVVTLYPVKLSPAVKEWWHSR
ncbi:hypothetical protein [Egbenema bharatensis]|uniref:hypothetical protein n=1 Tax=Egbenema bharatensis TaxID=3463334 RepID=UPI003A8994D7